MARRKKQEDPLQSLAGLTLFGSFFGTFYFSKSIIAAVIVLVIVFAIIFMVALFINQAREERLKKSGIADIDKMSGRQFEHYLGHLFRAHGYSVTVTQAAGDFGADLVISKDNKKIIIQAKRYSKNVGLKAVQEAHGAILHYGATEAWVISNSGYTPQAYELAKSNGVKLIDREQLIEMILKLNPGVAPQPKAVMNEVTEDITCSRCGSDMVKRKGARGEFLGCSSFPKCRNTIA
jgi:restriction system protein